ncbi:RES family NAD+ phosphorylase [Piscinibacter koreensis]|uniref:RES family NAD+ phosphorylase n=1 Tax=Piscinibacter koreensis TaxID=2742824 RepID=A0A7Y6NMX1_9BURK|nr:RES family NAD+ phosphorylase [Schlegelella koreensis]NUZ06148.1 RES family NAD+ phosphorylase [Schlegelella koreensis]
MTVALWRIATDAPDYEAHDLGGRGAEKTGGRWNRKGRPVVYSASSIALACLETIVHLNADGLPLNRFLVRIEVPDEVWARREVRTAADLPVGWSAIPEGKVSLDTGDAWLQSGASALLLVPSVIVPEEFNALVNPAHRDAARLVARKERPWFYDQRLVP